MSGDYSNQQRPRSRTTLSFGSVKSNNSGPRFTKDELVETSKEKASKRISTKANPNVAMSEIEPTAQALAKPTMNSNLRGMQHKDMFGNIITDPDRSNPTRPRLERPLDTIRSFEAAVDGRYGRMSSYTETPGPSRPPSSYFGMNGNGYGRSGRPESYIDSAVYGNSNRRSPAPFGTPQHRRGFGPRNNSDPMLYGSNGTYPPTQQQQQQPPRREPYQPSYDSIGSSGGSGGTDNWNQATNPSSPSSSVDRFQTQPPAPPKHDLGEQYGFSGFAAGPQTDFDAQGQNGYYNDNSHGQYHLDNGAPPPPPHKGYGPGGPVNQQGQISQKTPLPVPPPPVQRHSNGGERRKSWLLRRFSKD